jgi:hypothetical protein
LRRRGKRVLVERIEAGCGSCPVESFRALSFVLSFDGFLHLLPVGVSELTVRVVRTRYGAMGLAK